MPSHPTTTTDAPAAAARSDRLPVLRTVAVRTLEVLGRRGAAVPSPDLVQIAEVDLALTAAVLRVARSPLYGPDAPRTSLPDAIGRLGAERMVALVDGLARLTPRSALGGIDVACRSWTCALAAGAAVRWLANQGEYEDPAEAYLAGLLAGYMSADEPGGRSASHRATVWRFGPRVERALAGLFPETDSDLRPHAASLPPDDATLQLQELLRLACAIVAALGYGDPARAAPEDALEYGAAGAVAEAIALELAHAASLLRLPGGDPGDFAVRLAAEERRVRCLPPPSTDDQSPERAVGRIVRVYDALSVLRPDTVVRDTTIHEILDGGLATFHAALAFERVILFERDPGRSHVMRVRRIHCRTDLPRDAAQLAVEVPADSHSTLARAADLRGGAAIRTTQHRSDAPLHLLLGSTEAAVAPVRANSGAVGVIVADHMLCGRAPDDEDLETLGVAAALLGLVLENAARMAEAHHLRALAEKDELTGINNRRCVLELLRREVDRARRYGKPLSVALVDVDHFKSWNDLHGHPVGDMILASVAQLISSVGREIDAYGRYGGEEFLIVLPETTAEHAMIYAERLRTTIEAHGLELAQTYAQSALTVSIGVTQLHPRGDDDRALIARADAALYAAKHHGRNRVCVEMAATPVPAAPTPSRGVLDEL